jgi:endonuclease-8
MPEGDTIFRAARTLNRALAGHEVVRFESVFPALLRVEVTGRTVERVTAVGKHLLMRFSGDLVLRTHMRMNGSWHIYRPGEKWRRQRRDMRLLVATRTFEAVGFNVPVAELLDPRALDRHRDLSLLGPDLLGDSFNADEAVRRFRARPSSSVADGLINQRIVAGAGNIYKSELLFLCGIHPFRLVETVADETLHLLLTVARKYLRANVVDGRGRIVTYTGYRRTASREPADQLYVYGRARLPCRKCGTRIQVAPQGPNARLTYWCPSCQPEGGQKP